MRQWEPTHLTPNRRRTRPLTSWTYSSIAAPQQLLTALQSTVWSPLYCPPFIDILLTFLDLPLLFSIFSPLPLFFSFDQTLLFSPFWIGSASDIYKPLYS